GWLNAASRAASHHLVDTVELVYPALEDTAEDRANASLAMPAMRRDALLDNVRRAAAYDLDRRFGLALASRTGRSFSGDAWSRFEARYDFLSHSVVLGPVLIQALLADAGGPAARYSTLGTTLAHEMLHMFGAPTDRKFTPRQPVGWIDAADQPGFNAMVGRLEQDYATWVAARYHLAVKPRFMGEDLSDLGSVPVALSALRHAGGDGTGSEDAFYRAFAGSMRTRQSDEDDRSFLTSSYGHALYSYRINGPLSNLPSFSRHYGCVAGDAMVRSPEARVALW
ncbi:MAG TPA: M13-type metalloendopeptidase, partial [Variovorax sp.]|nr:M13-type metalloendopeptidase [Variovorax sp.]